MTPRYFSFVSLRSRIASFQAWNLIMSHLNNVPDDILLCIIVASLQHDLVRVSSVNRRFHTLVEPHMYHTIQWTWERYKIPPILLLLRSILARPLLATHIRRVDLRGDTFHLPPFRRKFPPKISVAYAEMNNILAVVEQSKVPNGGPLSQGTSLRDNGRNSFRPAITTPKPHLP